MANKTTIERRIRNLQERIAPTEGETYALQWDDGEGPWGYISSNK